MIVLALAALQNAAAQESPEMSGGYLGVALGSFEYEESEYGFGTLLSDSASVYRIYGGYRFNDNFAVEGTYGETGELEESISLPIPPFGTFAVDTAVDFEILTVRVLGFLPLKKVSLFGGIGYADMTGNVSATVVGVPGASASDSADDDGSTLVAGLQFELERVAIRGEFELFDTDSGVDMWDASIGVAFRF
jgi:OOP family OmpA-OmpF porin